MTYTSNRPISVDGVRLDTLAWGIEKINRAVASRRSADVQVPGLDGELPSLNDDLEAVPFGLEMFLRGTDLDGKMPVGQNGRDLFRANLDEVIHLFGKRHALLEIREQVAPTVTRRAFAKVLDTIAPEITAHGGHGKFAVSLMIPAGVWEDVDSTDWNSGVVTAWQDMEVLTLRGATERTNDAIITVKGPAVAPSVRDVNTGGFVKLNRNLTATEVWRINCRTWSTRVGVGLTLDSADTTGTDVQALTDFGGMLNNAAFLSLVPVRDPNDAAVVLPDLDTVNFVTAWASPGQAIALDTDGVPYVTTVVGTGAAVALDDDQNPYLTGAPGVDMGSRLRRVRIALGGSGITTATRVQVRARRKYAL